MAFLALGCQNQRGSSSAAPPIFMLHTDTGAATFGAVDVLNLDPDVLKALERASPSLEQWHEILTVRIAELASADTTPLALLGRYAVDHDRLRFTPRFAPVPGQPYHVQFDGAALQRVAGLAVPAVATTLDTTWLLAEQAGSASTAVLQVFPTSDRLPVNLLRLYVHFSAPMSRGEAYRRVHLVDGAGNEVEDAFLVVAGEKELWDPERRRLTILFDPGRIKRDLRPNLEIGLPLREGGTFTLVIDSVWQDARGLPLVSPFSKRFTVGPADRAAPRTQDWQLTAPRAATREPVLVRFPESLDQALLERLLAVKRADGGLVPGTVTIDEGETRWRFAPDRPWQAGAYYVEVGTDLEDLAGNNLRQLFDVDRKSASAPTVTTERVSVPFVVR